MCKYLYLILLLFKLTQGPLLAQETAVSTPSVSTLAPITLPHHLILENCYEGLTELNSGFPLMLKSAWKVCQNYHQFISFLARKFPDQINVDSVEIRLQVTQVAFTFTGFKMLEHQYEQITQLVKKQSNLIQLECNSLFHNSVEIKNKKSPTLNLASPTDSKNLSSRILQGDEQNQKVTLDFCNYWLIKLLDFERYLKAFAPPKKTSVVPNQVDP